MTGTAAVPFQLAFGGLVFVDVTVNGTPMAFILDSGAESTVLNASRLPALGLAATGTFAAGAGGGDVTVGYVPHVTYAVGDAVIDDQMRRRSRSTPSRARSAASSTASSATTSCRASWSSSTTSRSRCACATARRTTTRRARRCRCLSRLTPFVDAAVALPGIAAVPGHFTLDTGCLCEVELSSPFTDEHHLLAAVPDAHNAGFSAGAGGETHQVTATITSLRIGTQTIDKPVADFSRDTTGATADPESAGLIGALCGSATCSCSTTSASRSGSTRDPHRGHRRALDRAVHRVRRQAARPAGSPSSTRIRMPGSARSACSSTRPASSRGSGSASPCSSPASSARRCGGARRRRLDDRRVVAPARAQPHAVGQGSDRPAASAASGTAARRGSRAARRSRRGTSCCSRASRCRSPCSIRGCACSSWCPCSRRSRA